jgi:glycosyltransferase involved in cell wall biosynthesis
MRIVLTRREALDSPDGVNIFMVALGQALIDLNHEVKLVVGSLQNEAEYRRRLAPRLGLPILSLSPTPLKGFASVAAWLGAKRTIDRFNPDLVIHSETVPLPLHGTVIQVVHDLQPRSGRLAPVWRGIRRFSTKRCDYVVATTTELRDELVRDLGMPPNRLTVIPKCIDLQAYKRAPLSSRERAVLHAGTWPYKRPEATIRAFGALDDPSVRLYVAGDINESTREAVDALPDRVRSQVTLLGDVDGQTLRKLHGQVRVAAFPTSYAIPVASATVMEAIASGTPILGSSLLSRDVLMDGANGLVVDTNPSAMVIALRALLNDDALWSRLSQGACRMSERFDASRVARQYIELALAKRSRPTPKPSEHPSFGSRIRKVALDSRPGFSDGLRRREPTAQRD